jgi:hypothetical protein
MIKSSIIIILSFIYFHSFEQPPEKLISDFKNETSIFGVGEDVTISLKEKIDLEKVIKLHGNRIYENCPEFGVFGSNYSRLLVNYKSIEKISENKAIVDCRYNLTNKILDKKLLISIDRILKFQNTESQRAVVEIFLTFNSTDGEINGFGRVVTAITDNYQLADRNNFVYEEGFKNQWIGSYKPTDCDEKLIAWGFERFPAKYFSDFDIGGGELSINYKYLENGWSKTFSKADYIRKEVENIPTSDYNFYGVKSIEEIIQNWDQLEAKIGAGYGEGIGQLDLECPATKN